MCSASLRVLLLCVLSGCGVGARNVVIHQTLQPKLSTMKLPSQCLEKPRSGDACLGDRILLSSNTASPALQTKVGEAIGGAGYHEVVHSGDARLTILVEVNVDRPAYRGEESQQYYPEKCLRFEQRCSDNPGMSRCLRSARKIRSVRARDKAVQRCRKNHRSCSRVCVSLRRAYTEYRLSEVCQSRLSLDVRRFVNRSGEAVGGDAGLSLGQPGFDGESTSRLIQKNQKPVAVGADTMCRRAFDNAVSQVSPWFNPSKIHTTYIFADLEAVPYRAALLDLQFGRYSKAHEQLDETFRQASFLGLSSKDVAWVHHAKAATFYLQEDVEQCSAQLRIAAGLNAELSNLNGDPLGQAQSPFGSFRRLIVKCAVNEEQ